MVLRQGCRTAHCGALRGLEQFLIGEPARANEARELAAPEGSALWFLAFVGRQDSQKQLLNVLT